MTKIPLRTKGHLLNARIAYFNHLRELINEADIPAEEKEILNKTTAAFNKNYIWAPQISREQAHQGVEAYTSLEDTLREPKKDLLNAATTRILPFINYKQEATTQKTYKVVQTHKHENARGAIIDTTNRTIIYGAPNKKIKELTITSKPIHAEHALHIPGLTNILTGTLKHEYETGIISRLNKHRDPEKGDRMYLKSVPSSFEEAEFLEEKKGNFWEKSSKYHVKLR